MVAAEREAESFAIREQSVARLKDRRLVPMRAAVASRAGELSATPHAEPWAHTTDSFTDRVLRIYIRTAGRVADARRLRDIMLVNSPVEAACDAALRGLASPGCVEETFPFTDGGVQASTAGPP